MTQLTIWLPTYSASDPGNWNVVVNRAMAADRAGVDRVTAPEHVVFGENLDAYSKPEIGGAARQSQPTGPDGHWLDSLTALTWVAAHTERVRISTSILLAALRTPATLAKQLATIDVFSGGRLDLGVGVGWQREEYVANGVEFEERGRRLDEVLAVLRLLWREPIAAYDGSSLKFEGIHMQPKPVQAGGIPIWVSGSVNKAVVRRVGKYGAGWILWGPAATNPAEGIAQMHHALEDAGFDPSGLQVAGHMHVVRRGDGWMDVDATMANVPPLVEAGLTDVHAWFSTPDDVDEATDYYGEVVAAFRKVTC